MIVVWILIVASIVNVARSYLEPEHRVMAAEALRDRRGVMLAAGVALGFLIFGVSVGGSILDSLPVSPVIFGAVLLCHRAWHRRSGGRTDLPTT